MITWLIIGYIAIALSVAVVIGAFDLTEGNDALLRSILWPVPAFVLVGFGLPMLVLYLAAWPFKAALRHGEWIKESDNG